MREDHLMFAGRLAASTSRTLLLGVALAVIAAGGCRSTPSTPVDAGCPQGSVIAFGDSITFGAGLPPAQSYPAQLSQLLGAPVCNAGVNGDTIEKGVKRLQRDVIQFRPAAVLVLFGSNDSGLFDPEGNPVVPVAQYERDLVTILKSVRSIGGVAYVLTMTPMNAPLLQQQGLHPENWGAYDAAIRAVAASQGAPLIDLTVVFDGDLGLLQDGLHPTADGAAKMANAVAAAMNVKGRAPTP